MKANIFQLYKKMLALNNMPTKCPKGKILRSAYTRKDGTHVAATCVPDKGKPGKTPAADKVLPKLKPGMLGQFGYHDVKNLTLKERHAALTKSVQNAGYATTIRRLNAVANYDKLSDPVAHKIFRADMNWVRNNLGSTYSTAALREASRKESKKASRKASKLVKAGSIIVSGRERQLYHLPGSQKTFYRYRKADGKLARRYV
jgi:hypothetical protein